MATTAATPPSKLELGHLPCSSTVGEEEERPSIPNTDQPLPLSIVKKTNKTSIRTASGQTDMSGSPGEERVISVPKRRVRKQLSCRGAASPEGSPLKVRRIKPERSFLTNSSAAPGRSSLGTSSVSSMRYPGRTTIRGRLDHDGELRTASPRLNGHAPLGEFSSDADVSSSVSGLDNGGRGVPVLVPDVKVTPESKVLSDDETTV